MCLHVGMHRGAFAFKLNRAVNQLWILELQSTESSSPARHHMTGNTYSLVCTVRWVWWQRLFHYLAIWVSFQCLIIKLVTNFAAHTRKTAELQLTLVTPKPTFGGIIPPPTFSHNLTMWSNHFKRLNGSRQCGRGYWPVHKGLCLIVRRQPLRLHSL